MMLRAERDQRAHADFAARRRAFQLRARRATAFCRSSRLRRLPVIRIGSKSAGDRKNPRQARKVNEASPTRTGVSIFQGSFANPLAAHKSSILAAPDPVPGNCRPAFRSRHDDARPRNRRAQYRCRFALPNPGFPGFVSGSDCPPHRSGPRRHSRLPQAASHKFAPDQIPLVSAMTTSFTPRK